MDTVTQIALGASVAAACVPKGHRRKALLIGAALGTLPDLDVFIDYGDAVDNFTYHRGFSHSLFVLTPFAIGLWYLLKRFWSPAKLAPQPWFWAIMLALITHPLLDAHTAYGTQLFWPIQTPPVMWTTLFIIDPFYTLPLLVGALVLAVKPNGPRAYKTLVMGLVISTCYLGWSWWAKTIIEHKVIANFDIESPQTTLFTTPTPFNTLFWRAVVLKEDDYYEIYLPVFGDAKPSITTYPKNQHLLDQAQHLRPVARLNWFAQGFIKAERIDNQLVIADLRMGVEPHYVFRHVVAEQGNPHWQVSPTTLLPKTHNWQDVVDLLKKLSDK
ncbi:MAG: inner membrane protein [Cellvibrionaceae bacterium]|jgi:inner membrane protein